MKKITEAMYANYLNGIYDDIVQPFKPGEKRKEFDKLWDNLNQNLTDEEKNRNYTMLQDACRETGLFDFTNAFRLGFLFCTEIYLSKHADEREQKGEQS